MDSEPGKWQLTNILNDGNTGNDPPQSEQDNLKTELAKQRLCVGSNCSPGSGAASTTDSVKPKIDIATPKPSGHVNGVVPIMVTSRDNVAVTRVDYKVRQGASVVATMTASAAPFSTSWNSAAGNYTIEAIAYDAQENASDPATVSITVDGFDVQTANPTGPGDGNPANGDSLVYTFPQAVDPGSLKTGWNGSGTTTVTVNLEGDSAPDPFYNDRITISGTGVPTYSLGEIDLGGAWYWNFQETPDRVYSNSQMSLSNGNRTVTIVMGGGPTSTGQINTTPSIMTWRTGVATSGGAIPCIPPCQVTESGFPHDREF